MFGEITWDRRPQILNRTTKKEEGCSFFETDRARVLSLVNAPEWPLLKGQRDLLLTELIWSTYWGIFPARAFLAQSNTKDLD